MRSVAFLFSELQNLTTYCNILKIVCKKNYGKSNN